MEDRVKVCFDKEYHVRVLDPVKFTRAEELQSESTVFVDSKR